MKMKFAIFILVCFATCLGLGSPARIVCSFLSWTIYRRDIGEFAAKHVDPTLCTHIVYSSVGLNDDATVHVLDDWELSGLEEIRHLQELRRINPDVQIIVSMGGWSEGSGTYSKISNDTEQRATLVKNVLEFVGTHEFDGFDLDWEYPARREDSDNQHDPDNYIALLKDLKAGLNAQGYTFSVSASGQVWFIIGSYPDTKKVTDNVDFVNVRSLDYHSTSDPNIGHFAPLYPSHLDTTETSKTLTVDAGIQHWLDYGADPAKLNIAVASYGSTYTLANPLNHNLYDAAKGPGESGPYTQETGLLGYYEICGLHEDWAFAWDDEQEVPHRYGGDQWVGYENERSIQAKIDYAKRLGLGGVLFWSLDTDDFLGTCGDGKFPLLQYVNDNIWE